MASPFHFFRKHQKAFLVIAGVMAMFIFVFADLFTSMVSKPAGQSPKTVVTSWDGGKLTVQEMNVLYRRRLFLHDFLSNLSQLGKYRVESEGRTPTPPSVPGFFLNANARTVNVMNLCVQERILADQAKNIGMAISDDMVNSFMYKTGFEKVGDQDIGSILQRMRRFDMRTSEEMLFAGLRELLLGHLYLSSISGSVGSVPPEQLWEDWMKVNDRIALEAALLPIETFLSEVPEPTEGQLISFYEQHKNRISDAMVNVGGNPMASPVPGFRAQRKVKLNYLLGDVTAWTQEMLPSVTDEEIADYYERNKRTQFVKLASDTVAADTEDITEDSAAGEDSSVEDEVEDEKDTSAGEEASAEDEKDTSAGEEASDEEASDENEEDSSEGEEASAEGDDATEDPAEGEAASEVLADDEADSEADTEADSDTDEEEVEYEPLEEVSAEIRRLLANDKAVLELKRLMESAFGDLTTVYNRYGGELIEARSEEKEVPPVPARLADLSALAKEKKLISEETVLLSRRDMSETGVGKAVDAQTGKRVVTQAAFSDLRPYEPLLAQDLDGYWYLVLKVEDTPSQIPEMEKIHDQVAAAWKRSQAVKLALAKGEQLAKEAKESGKTLEAFFTDGEYEITTTDLFSWFTFGNTPVEMQRGPRLGDAPPLSAVGDQFMQKAFDLKPEEVIALLNFDHTNAYVLKLATRERTEVELHTAFLSEVNNSQTVQILFSIRMQNAQQMLLGQVLQRVNLDRQRLQSYLQAVAGR